MPVLDSVNIGRPQPNGFKRTTSKRTGIGKRPTLEPVQVRAPGPKRGGLGGGLVGDFIGDDKHHGGDSQAVYAFQREDLDAWAYRLGRELPNGFFGENLTTRGLEVNEALLGERWAVGPEVVLQVTTPRTPCATFRGWVGEKGWARMFSVEARPGAYLKVLTPGVIRAGDPIEVISRPDHQITLSMAYKASITDRALLPRLLEAGDDLDPELRTLVERGRLITLD